MPDLIRRPPAVAWPSIERGILGNADAGYVHGTDGPRLPEARRQGASVRTPPDRSVAVNDRCRHARPMIVPLTSPTHAQVRDALGAIYQEFAAPAPSRIEGCPCCISTRGVDVLVTTPLRHLSGQALWRYVSGAFLTIGADQDFRYLLPRIFEIAVNEPESFINPEIVLGKLKLANWSSWPAVERRVVEDFVNAWFEHALARDLAEAEADEFWIGSAAESVLCGAACSGLPLGRWLARLQESDANRVVADLKERFPGRLSAFWDDAPAGLEELSGFLARQA